MKKLSEMTWMEIEGEVARSKCVMLPIGSVEQHGPHLPIATDTIIAEEIAKRISARLGIPIAPTIPYGLSLEHIGFPGTITLTPNTLITLTSEIASSLKKTGFRNIFIINGHSGNTGVLDAAARSIKSILDVDVYVFNAQEILAQIALEKGYASKSREHAGAVETSIMKYLRREVKPVENKVREGPKTYPSWTVSYGWSSKEHTEDGVIGSPAEADVELGRELIEGVVKYICDAIRELTKCSQE